MNAYVVYYVISVVVVGSAIITVDASVHRSKRNSASCSFPQTWRGEWYQNGLGDVLIHHSSISDKGTCIDNKDDFYLLDDKTRNCRRCLLILHRHHNVLQYKESYCVPEQTLKQVCARMVSELPLYTLVKVPAIAVPCPFQEAFQFAYQNNSHGFCREPMSQMKPCAEDGKYRFQFKKCRDVYDTYDRELEFQCLATWKTGSDMFVYGGFSGAGVISRDEMYRCMMYEVLGNEVYISMSADASCLGFLSPRDGPVLLELLRDRKAWPESKCSFPSSINKGTWRDLSGKHIYKLEKEGKVLSVNYQRHVDLPSSKVSSLRCIDSNREDKSTYVIVAHATHECTSFYQCIKIKVLNTEVLEITLGKTNPKSMQCNIEDFDNKTRRIVFPDTIAPQACPIGKGIYSSHSDRHRCSHTINGACNVSSTLHFKNTCYPNQEVTLTCLSHWTSGSKLNVIAQLYDIEENKMPANCFIFENELEGFRFQADPTCNFAVDEILDNSFSDIFYPVKKSCTPSTDINDIIAEGVTNTATQSVMHCQQIICFLLPVFFTLVIAINAVLIL